MGAMPRFFARVNHVDAVAALAVTATGIAGLLLAADLPVGTPRRMGAGFFPVLLGAILILSGLLLAAAAARPGHALPRPAWRALAMTLLAILAFAVSIERLGLVPAVALVALVASAADRTASVKRAVGLAVVLPAASWFLFALVLQLPLRAFRWPFV